ncbi:MAG TPA: hypothetical protein PKL65_12040 [Bacteroidales bacterium]|jgi:hypothetical protein|nr:hypothetical protein [Bacteroidales bacterium]HNR42953.1 hypothetical protein [Bacteroidales bacterium]HQG78619.1 hypothetical protein [Bacteroidales bacterium]
MLDKKVISFKGLEVKITDHANDDILGILNKTVLGSEGGLRYQLRNIPSRIEEYRDKIRFVSLYKAGRITGTVGACYRITGQGILCYPSTYIRYLAFQSGYQAYRMTRQRRRDRTHSVKDDTFKEKTLAIFSKPGLFEFADYKAGDKHIMYAFVESMNERSKNMVSQAGYDHIRSFLTVTFSRFSPKTDSRVSKLTDPGKKEMEFLLCDYYRNYSLFSTDYVFYGDRYYVLREGSEIIAGVNAMPSSFRIYEIPGVWGWVIMKVLPKVPYFKRLFYPEEFRHLVFDAIYCKKGYEDSLADLFESVCASEGYNTGLIWLDDRSDLFDKLRSGVRMGALNRMLNAKPGLVYAKFLNLTEKEKEEFYDAPVYISGFDFS